MSAAAKTNRLVIVESPAKARTIAGYLGSGYVVEASFGHVRDLPRNAADVPATYRDKPWARLGVDVDHDFAALYVVTPDRKQQLAKLKKLAGEAGEILLATDEDREGEAIAWHLVETLAPTVSVKRMVFHEITKPAISAAVANPRGIDRALVDAQEARRILDRLYGYEVSPVLWKKVMPKGPDGAALSAGRVQSVATRIVVERERQRMRFRTAQYWDVSALLAVRPGGTRNGGEGAGAGAGEDGPRTFRASMIALDGDRIASGKDFDPATGAVRANASVVHLDADGARGLAARLDGRPFTVTRVEEKPYRRRPYPPFITSTMQQEAARKLRFSSETTMRVAQRLYENGYITYMRTDSVNLSESAITAARAQVRELYGEKFVPPSPRRYTGKVKNAQEAHEAVRPAGEAFRTPGDVARELSAEEFKLYELIWRRTIASQMTDAVGSATSVRIRATSSTGEECDFGASGKTITDPGFLRAYVESSDDEDAEADDAERRLPTLVRDQSLTAQELAAAGHTTSPPARYTEASLIKALEELGIGRPSTYTSIMKTIKDRGYVTKRGQALVPSFLAFAVVSLLERHFPQLVDYAFTAGMEDELDDIAGGRAAAGDFLRSFYFGGATGGEGSVSRSGGLKRMVTEQLGDIDARGINSIPLFDSVVVRVGRYGPYLQRGEADDEHDRVSIPDTVAPDELTPDKVDELFARGSGERTLGADPTSGQDVLLKSGRFGPYVQAGERRSSLLRTQSPDELTLADALRLLTLPRVVGVAADGQEIMASNGRFGPYVRKGNDSRSLDSEAALFTVTLEQAEALFAAPKTRGRAQPAPPLRELGQDPATGDVMVIKEGRFGPYVTDGQTNASLRRGQTVEALTPQEAADMLADKRAKGPAPRKAATKRAATRTGAARTGATKTGATKTGAVKTGATKTGTAKTGATKTGTAKTGATKTGTAKTGAAKKTTKKTTEKATTTAASGR